MLKLIYLGTEASRLLNGEMLRAFLLSQKQEKDIIYLSYYLSFCWENILHGLSAGLVSTFVPEYIFYCLCIVNSYWNIYRHNVSLQSRGQVCLLTRASKDNMSVSGTKFDQLCMFSPYMVNWGCP